MLETDTTLEDAAVLEEQGDETVHEESTPVALPMIGGAPYGGGGPTLPCVSPTTGEVFAEVSSATAAEIDRAVDAATFTSALWRGMAFEERSKRIEKLADLVARHADAIARLVSLEQGKPTLEALTLEVLPTLDHLRFLARQAAQFFDGGGIEPRHPLYAHKHCHYLFDPLGVVVVITPDPLPFAIPMIHVGAALIMGNAVVIKPSERTPLSALRIGELCVEAGLPGGLVNVVPCLPEETLRLVAHPNVDKVFYAGGEENGQNVMATAGCVLRPVVLSLGGKHPSVVAADANLERAAKGIVWGALSNCGQNCGAVERVYVDETVAATFVELVLAEVDEIRVGDPIDDGIDLGPLVSSERRDDVHDQVTEAIGRGARVLRGGEIPEGPGFFYPPTVLLGPPSDSRLMQEETLGPVIPIVAVDSMERALLLANDSEYALTASGWTRSAATAERLMVALRAGVVTVNDVLYSFGEPASTWSGFRRSGLGHNHGTSGLREMCRQRFVSFDGSSADTPLFAYPYDEAARRMVQTSIRALHGKGRFRRLLAGLGLARQRRFRARVPWRSFLFAGRRNGR